MSLTFSDPALFLPPSCTPTYHRSQPHSTSTHSVSILPSQPPHPARPHSHHSPVHPPLLPLPFFTLALGSKPPHWCPSCRRRAGASVVHPHRSDPLSLYHDCALSLLVWDDSSATYPTPPFLRKITSLHDSKACCMTPSRAVTMQTTQQRTNNDQGTLCNASLQ